MLKSAMTSCITFLITTFFPPGKKLVAATSVDNSTRTSHKYTMLHHSYHNSSTLNIIMNKLPNTLNCLHDIFKSHYQNYLLPFNKPTVLLYIIL